MRSLTRRRTSSPEEALKIVLRLWLCGRKIDIVIHRLTRWFNAGNVVVRLVIWSDLALAWGPILPLIAVAGLMIVKIELWCHGIAVARYRVSNTAEELYFFRTYLFCGLGISGMLLLAHLVSSLETNMLPMAAVALVASFFLSFFIHSWVPDSFL